ncbi:hypothetical protein EDD21DRAFT_367634 [Dissophora ornata]|nr:hypothetical protein EDD21DRAFT_367634 [Dissophora ornata]
MADTLNWFLGRIGTTHQLTSAFHPRVNGKCGHTNGVIGAMLNKFVGNHRSSWDRYLLQVFT